MNRLIAFLRSLFRREPAVVLGSVATAVLWLQSVVTDASVTNWKAAGPVIAAAVIRRFVTPADAALIRYLPSPNSAEVEQRFQTIVEKFDDPLS